MVHDIPWPGPGRLATLARPRGGDWLPDEMSRLASSGVDVLVSALTHEEAVRLALETAPAAAADAGLRFISFPIPDRGVPAMSDTLNLAVRLAAEFRAGRSVAIHCFAGIGRSTVLAGATLVVLGATADDAFALITRARGLQVPDTPGQVAWLHTFADNLKL